MQTTEYYGLRMPEGTDPADISDINYNTAIIDEALHAKVDVGEQSMTPEEQEQARENIGAAAEAEVMKIIEQTLSNEEKAQARTNIGLTIKDYSISSAEVVNTRYYDVSNSTRAVIFLFGEDKDLCGVATVYCSASGTVGAKSTAEKLTVGRDPLGALNKILVHNQGTATCYMKMLIFNGDITR